MNAPRSQPPQPDARGQGSVEFVGIVIMASVLVGALVFAMLQSSPRIAATVESKICEITTLGEGDCSASASPTVPDDDEVPTYADPSLTPVERAESGEYVALGDSYSSGEGGSEYEEGTDVDREAEEAWYWATHDEDGNPLDPPPRGPNGQVPPPEQDPYSNVCHRSTGAYPQLVNEAFDFSAGYTFAACSGAVTADFYRPNGYDPDDPAAGNDGEIPQLDQLDDDTSLVTVTIGGNDAEFADILKDCIVAGLNPLDACTDEDEVQAIEDSIDIAIENLEDLLPQIRANAPNARILIIGYPRFFPTEPLEEFDDGTQIDVGDITFINDKVREMDDRIAELVEDMGGASAGFEYVDVYDVFDGCEIGTSNPCMNNIEVRFSDGNLDVNGSYHPNDRGHDLLAVLVEGQVTNGG